jgi:hypothetical protein
MAGAFQLNDRAIATALVKVLETSRRKEGEVVMTTLRGVLRFAIAYTPPGSDKSVDASGNYSGMEARRRGESAMERDVRHIFQGTTPARAKVQLGQMRSIHDQIMNVKKTRGGLRRDVVPKVKVARSSLTAYLREAKKRVGKLAAGWIPAATELGKIRVPAWISRHGVTGKGFTLKIQADSVVATISNITPFADNVKGMRRRLQFAVNAQANAMERSVATYYAKKLRDSGFTNA